MKGGELLTAGRVDDAELERFLARFFPPSKVRFLTEHGKWWHRGAENRWVVTAGGAIGGYCAVIPTRCLVAGREHEAVWWVDLVIAPEHRGKGFERLFDERVKGAAELVLGFPNELAARIHRRHGWGVREDLQVRLLPLVPRRVRAVSRASGARSVALRLAALVTSPAAAIARRRLAGFRTGLAWEVADPDAAMLAGIFERFRRDAIVTTVRDASHINWRYLSAPYRPELRLYGVGHRSAPTVVVVMRLLEVEGRVEARVLDLFGDLAAAGPIRAALRLAVRDAVQAGATQVTLLASDGRVGRAARQAGLIVPARVRVCWWSSDLQLRATVGAGQQHWVLGDSDNDRPG